MQEKSSDTQPKWYTLGINRIILTDYSRQVVPKPNPSAKYTEIFFKYRFSDTITNGLNNGMSPGNHIFSNLSYCVNLLLVTQLLISTFRGIDEWLRGWGVLFLQRMIFSSGLSWLRVSWNSSFEGRTRPFFLLSLINPSRGGPKGPLRNKVLFPTREKEIIAILLIMLKAVAYKHVVLSGFWTSCTGLEGFQNSE